MSLKFTHSNLQHVKLLMETAEELDSLSCIHGFNFMFIRKACEEMKHVIVRNREHISNMYTLHKGVNKNVLPPFPVKRFLRQTNSAICDSYMGSGIPMI